MNGMQNPFQHVQQLGIQAPEIEIEIQAPELSELEGVELELGSCCSDLDKQVSDEICRTRKRPFEIPFRL